MSQRGEWGPMGDLQAVQRRMNELFEQAMARTNFEANAEVEGWTPVCDVYETSSSLFVRRRLASRRVTIVGRRDVYCRGA